MKLESIDLNDEASIQQVVKLCSTMYDKGVHDIYDLFVWKHLKNPFGKSICFGAFDSGKLVGVRIFMAWRFFYKDSSVLAYRPVDTITDPNYLRRGIFSALTKLAVEEAKIREAAIIFNTPNEKSLPGNRKLGWTLGFKNTVYVKPYKPFKILFLKGFSIFSKSLSVKRNLSFDAEDMVDPYFEDTALPLSGTTETSKEFLIWRYIEHPLDQFHIVNERDFTFVVKLNLRDGLKELVLCDLLIRSVDIEKAKVKVVQNLNLISKRYGVDYLVHKERSIVEKFKTLKANFLSLYIKRPTASEFFIENLSLGDLESF